MIKSNRPLGLVLCPNLLLPNINDLPNSIPRSFVNIDADDTTVYRYTSKILNDKNLMA